MAKNDIGGVWRTVGGRRIFIKDGQDLSSAMKESGKFKTTAKANEDKAKREAEFEKNIDKMYNRFHGKTDEQIANEIAKERGERILTDKEQKEREVQFMKKLENETKQDTLSKETKGYRHLNENNLGKGYEIEKVTDSGTYQVNYGNEEKKLLIHQDDTGYYVRNGGKKEYFDSNMNQKLEKQGVKGINDLKSSNKENKTSGEKTSESSKTEAKNYMQDQFKAFDKGDISGADLEKAKRDSGLSRQEIEEARNYVNNRAPESYPRQTENKTGKTTSQAVPKTSKTNDWVRNAFNDYKKEHPNTKMTLEQFKKSKK